LGEGAVVDTAYLKLKAEADPKDVEQRIKDILGSEVTVTTSTHLIQQAAGMDVLQRSTTQALVAILFALVLLLVVKTSIASVYERAREIGILRAVGWTSGEVRRLLLIEHVMQGAIALVAGLVLGLGIACAYARVVELKIPDALNKYPSCASTKAPVSIPEVIVRFEPDVLLLALVLSLGIALVSAGIAARRITRMYPAEALRQL
jgi:ABC-type antimicrobial peptide transport system permease subunit